jgi:hypothetical protein
LAGEQTIQEDKGVLGAPQFAEQFRIERVPGRAKNQPVHDP